MGDFSTLALALISGIGLGGFAVWFTRRQAEDTAHGRADELAVIVSKLTHDVRGALSPALLMAERLENHADPAVRQAATTITKSMDRAAAICRDTSAAAKRNATGG